MSFVLYRKEIRCPNCEYEGPAQIKGVGCGFAIMFIFMLLLSFLIWPLFIVVGIMLLYMVIKPADQICPECKYPNPIPI